MSRDKYGNDIQKQGNDNTSFLGNSFSALRGAGENMNTSEAQMQSLYSQFCVEEFLIRLEDMEEDGFAQEENMEQKDRYDSYLQEIRDIPPMGCEVEHELVSKMVIGDASAIETIIKANLYLVVHIAKEYANNGSLTIPELVAEGNLGLTLAANTFDLRWNKPFIQYTKMMIRQTIEHAIADQRTPRILERVFLGHPAPSSTDAEGVGQTTHIRGIERSYESLGVVTLG